MIIVVLLFLCCCTHLANAGTCQAGSDQGDGVAWFQSGVTSATGGGAIGGTEHCPDGYEVSLKTGTDPEAGCFDDGNNNDLWFIRVIQDTNENVICVPKPECADTDFTPNDAAVPRKFGGVENTFGWECTTGYVQNDNTIKVKCGKEDTGGGAAEDGLFFYDASNTLLDPQQTAACIRSTSLCVDAAPTGSTIGVSGDGNVPLTGTLTCASPFKLEEATKNKAVCHETFDWVFRTRCVQGCQDEAFSSSVDLRRFFDASGNLDFECKHGYVKAAGTPTCDDSTGSWAWGWVEGSEGTCTLPCDSDDCDANADCFDIASTTPPSFQCRCKQGFVDTGGLESTALQPGRKCEVLTGCTDTCHADATCTVSVGDANARPHCQCNKGFVDKHKDDIPGTHCISKGKFLDSECEECEDDKCGGESLIAPFLCLLEGFPV